jgi:hypothetical protein
MRLDASTLLMPDYFTTNAFIFGKIFSLGEKKKYVGFRFPDPT